MLIGGIVKWFHTFLVAIGPFLEWFSHDYSANLSAFMVIFYHSHFQMETLTWNYQYDSRVNRLRYRKITITNKPITATNNKQYTIIVSYMPQFPQHSLKIHQQVQKAAIYRQCFRGS